MISPMAAKLAIVAQTLIAFAKIMDAKHAPGAGALMNSYIVALDSGMYSDRGYSIHTQFYRDLVSRGVNWTTIKEYRDPLFTGAVIKLLSDSDLVKMTDVVGPQRIKPLHVYSALPDTRSTEPRELKRSENGGIPWSHTLTGVDRVHAAGYHGEGVTIGIIDSGVDYKHRALGGGFGPGYKVVGGYDFVGDDFTGRDDSPPTEPKPDPFENCYGHGTNVAGVLGANPNLERGVIGVAYMANLNAYRVLNCRGGLREDILIDALIRANQDPNDIITISLRYTAVWKRTMASVITDRIAAGGRIVTVSVGNHGEEGAWSTDYMGGTQRVISVGSVTTTSHAYIPGPAFPYVSHGSATGPTSDMRFGTALCAPGEPIMTTGMNGHYEQRAGTSIAASFVAGSIALWLQVKAESGANMLGARAAFQNTALPMRLPQGDMIDTIAHQGAGLLQVHEAIYSTSRMLPTELLLNDTMYAQLVWTVHIQNLGREAVTYGMTHTPAGTINTMLWQSKITGALRFVPQAATVRFSHNRLAVPAGSIRSVVVAVRPPTKLGEAYFPVYSGYIEATGSDGSTLRSGYLGLAASMKRMKVLNTSSTYMPGRYRSMTDDKPMSGPVIYTMRGTDTPVLFFGLKMSTALLRLELVDASERVGLVVKSFASRSHSFSRRLMSRCTSWALLPGTGLARGICGDRMHIVGLIEERWADGLIRWGRQQDWSERVVITRFSDGSPIPDGQYRLLLRVLKRYGNPKKKSDYEAWISPIFIVRRD